MTDKAKLFTRIITSICWTKGWGTTGTTQMHPKYDGEEDLKWLVDNGYLFHYHTQLSRSRGRYGQYGRRYYDADIYGLTKKGWSVAGKYVDAAGVELRYQFDHYPTRENPEGRKVNLNFRDMDIAIEIDDILAEEYN